MVLRRTNADLWGPAQVQSTGGALHAMLLDDFAAARKKSYFLEDRKAVTVLAVLKLYKGVAESVTGMRMVFIRTDNAPEFLSQIVQDWFKSVGIIHIPGPPYSSAANGTAERGIGHKTATVRAMMIDSGLATKWWAEAWAASDRSDNLLPTSRKPGLIPEVIFMGKKQDAGHLRVWGCTAYVHIPKEWGKDKVDPRGLKGRMIGYDLESHGTYRILIPETSEIIHSRDVIFKEGTGHRTLTAEGEYFEDGNSNDKDYDFLIENPPASSDTPEIPIPTPTHDSPPIRKTRTRKDHGPLTRRSARVIANNAKNNPPVETGTVTTPDDESEMSDLTDIEEGKNATTLLAPISSIAEPENRLIPKSYEEAMEPLRKHLWIPAMEKEMLKWVARGVVNEVPKTKDMKPIKVMWVFDLKDDTNGKLIERRAHCVVKGYTQIKGVHYWIT